MDKYNNNARNTANKVKEPGKREYLSNKAGELERARQDLDNIPHHNSDQFDRYIDPIAPLIDDYTDTLHNSDAQNAMKGAAKANNLAGYLEVLNKDSDLAEPYNTAGEVTDLMRGLMGDTPGVSYELGTSNEDALHETARNAMELDNLLKGGGSKGGAISAPRLPLGQARTFEDVAQAVAYNIQEQSKTFESESGNNVAKELANLAAAARSGDKQKLLLAAKAAAGHLLAYSKEITDIANKIPAKNTYEHDVQAHMIKCAGSIRNYATHLKILASVKAASIEQSKDTDQSLASICTELGDMMSQTLKSMSVTHGVILKPKH